MLGLLFFNFPVQNIILWSDILTSTIPDFEILSHEFVIIWSISVEVLQLMRVGRVIICFRPKSDRKSLYFFLF